MMEHMQTQQICSASIAKLIGTLVTSVLFHVTVVDAMGYDNDDNYSNVFRVTSQSFNYEIGFGIDFYLVYFKFSPSIRGIFSIQNELIQDNNSNSPWTSNIKNLLSQGIAINLTFE